MECDKLVTKCGKLVTDHGTFKNPYFMRMNIFLPQLRLNWHISATIGGQISR